MMQQAMPARYSDMGQIVYFNNLGSTTSKIGADLVLISDFAVDANIKYDPDVTTTQDITVDIASTIT